MEQLGVTVMPTGTPQLLGMETWAFQSSLESQTPQPLSSYVQREYRVKLCAINRTCACKHLRKV